MSRDLTKPARLLAAAALTTSLAGEAVAKPTKPSKPPAWAEASPVLYEATWERLLGEVWAREPLGRRDRSLITVTALATLGKLPQLESHVGIALDNGVTPLELSELVNHLAYYAGWPTGIQAAQVVAEVLDDRKLEVPVIPAPKLALDPEREAARQASVAKIEPIAPGLAGDTNGVLFGEVWRRPGLAPRDRSLVTVATLIAMGQAEQLPFHLENALANGLTGPEASEIVAHLAWYTGWPRAFSAVGPLKTVLAPPPPTPDALEVTRLADGRSFDGAPENFKGSVHVESGFAAFAPGRNSGAMVHFEAGAHTAWHTHPLGQVLLVTDGEGWVQSEGEARQTVRPGDVVRIPPDVRHWHGATATTAMSHVAVAEKKDGSSVTWMEHVPDDVYDGAE